MVYTQKEVDYNILIDLLTSRMFSRYIPAQKPKIGDWCIEASRLNRGKDRDDCIGKLTKIIDEEKGDYTIITVGGKEVTWHNSELRKIPDKYLRNK